MGQEDTDKKTRKYNGRKQEEIDIKEKNDISRKNNRLGVREDRNKYKPYERNIRGQEDKREIKSSMTIEREEIEVENNYEQE